MEDPAQDHVENQPSLEQNLTFRLTILTKLLEQQGAAILADTAVNLTGYRILKIVETYGALSVSDLSRHMFVDRAQISRSTVHLGALGLVAFTDDLQSKRKKIVTLSPDGRALVLSLAKRFNERSAVLQSVMGPQTLAGVWDAIEKLSRHLAP
jgi:DNA-binding MarR family transcriptional regulator